MEAEMQTQRITKLTKLYSASIPSTWRNMGWNGSAVGYKMNVGGEYMQVEALVSNGQVQEEAFSDTPRIKTVHSPFGKGVKSQVRYEDLPEHIQKRVAVRINEDMNSGDDDGN